MRLLRALLCCAALAAAAAPAARADIVATVPEGGFLTDVTVAPNGQVWLLQAGPGPRTTSIGAVGPGGVTWRRVPIASGEIGPQNRVFATPDGGAWALVAGRYVVRVAPDGALGRPTALKGDSGVAATVAADGTFWVVDGLEKLTRFAPTGASTTTPLKAPAPPATEADCAINVWDAAVVRAGEVWVLDGSCRRFVQLRPDGTVIQAMSLRPGDENRPEEPESIAGAPDGSAWIVAKSGFDTVVEHATAGGMVKITLPFSATPGPVVAAPDSSAWIAGAQCSVVHVTAAGAQVLPAPVDVDRMAVAPDGTLWLVAWSQLVHVAPGALAAPRSCHPRAIGARLPDAHRGAISLRALRTRGLRVRATRPVTMLGVLVVGTQRLTVQIPAGRTKGTIRLTDAMLARLASMLRHGHAPTIDLTFLSSVSPDGVNGDVSPTKVRVTR